MSSLPRMVTIDIETAPIQAWVWGLFDQNVGLNQINFDWTILSISWKWLDEDKVHYSDCRGDPRNDAHLLCLLWQILDEADFVIGQNVKKFDIRKINARLIECDFLPYSPVKVIDTMRQAKAAGMFTSNKLEYLSRALTDTPKSAHGKYPGFALWEAVLRDDADAWNEMQRYNEVDVLATEALYLKLRPWDRQHPSIAPHLDEFIDRDGHIAPRCTRCGSHDLIRKGVRRTTAGLYQRLQCKNCGGWLTTRYTENTAAQRRALLSSN